MIASYDRAPSRAVLSWLIGLSWLVTPAGSRAQDSEEVIRDPELEQAPARGRAPDGDEVIEDPDRSAGGDDHGWGGVYEGGAESGATGESSEPEDTSDPQANTGLARIELIGQYGTDLYHEGRFEDVHETRLRFDTEIDFRRSRKLRLTVGTRLDYFWALPARTDTSLVIRDAETDEIVRRDSVFDQDRHEFDLIPLSAYIDLTATPGLHLRIGSQPISLARADFYSPNDILAVQDLRGQPQLAPSGTKLAQPAVRMDWDLSSWATLNLVYVPWFMPHLSRPNRDASVTRALGATDEPLPTFIGDLVPPSFQTMGTDTALRFVGPEPDFTTPQVQGRLTVRGTGMELSLTGGTALERLAAIYMAPSLQRFFQDPDDGDALGAVQDAINKGYAVADVEYHRFFSVGIDGSFDIAPVTIAFEASYSPSRHLYAATSDNSRLPSPDTTVALTDFNVADKSIRRGVPVAQGTLHIEWIDSEGYGLIAEALWMQALVRPYDTTREWMGMIPRIAAYAGGIFGGSYQFLDGRVRIDLSGGVLVGPSFLATGQVEVKAAEGLYVNAGAQIYKGPTLRSAQLINIGSALDNRDQLFVGFRYAP